MRLNKQAGIIMALIGTVCCVQAGTFKDGPHFAYSRGGDVLESDTAFGWQVAYEFTPYLSAEFSITRQRDRFDYTFPPPPLASTFRLETVGLALSGRIGHRIGRFHAYGAGGAGYYRMRAKVRSVDAAGSGGSGELPPGVERVRVGADVDDVFGYHAALGLEVLLTPKLEVFAEYRWVYLDTDITFRRTDTYPDPNPRTPAIRRETTYSSTEFDYDHGLVRIGVNYRF